MKDDNREVLERMLASKCLRYSSYNPIDRMDLLFLLRRLNIKSFEQVEDIFRKVYPKDVLSPYTRRELASCLKQIS